MSFALLIILMGLLSTVVYQDFKDKEINWLLIPSLFVVFLFSGLLKIEIKELFTYFGINLVLVLLNLIGVTLIISIKEKKLVNIIDTYLGLGDILFFMVITIAFSPINFILFYLSSILLTTIIYGVIMLKNQNKKMLIPLAGTMSLMLMIALLFEYMIPSFQFYQDLLLIIE